MDFSLLESWNCVILELKMRMNLITYDAQRPFSRCRGPSRPFGTPTLDPNRINFYLGSLKQNRINNEIRNWGWKQGTIYIYISILWNADLWIYWWIRMRSRSRREQIWSLESVIIYDREFNWAPHIGLEFDNEVLETPIDSKLLLSRAYVARVLCGKFSRSDALSWE